MKKLLFVLGLVAMFSLTASAKTKPITYNFQFLTVNGDPYCDGMFLKNYGNPQTLVDGFHFDPYCFLELGIPVTEITFGVNGFLGPIPSNYQYGGGSGPVMILSDSALALLTECEVAPVPVPIHSTESFVSCPQGDYENINELPIPTTIYLINPTNNTWTLWLTGGGAGEFVVNYGTLNPQVGPLLKSAKPSQVSASQPQKSSLDR